MASRRVGTRVVLKGKLKAEKLVDEMGSWMVMLWDNHSGGYLVAVKDGRMVEKLV